MPDEKAKIEIELALQNSLPPSLRAFSRVLDDQGTKRAIETGTGNFKKVRDHIEPLNDKAEKTSHSMKMVGNALLAFTGGPLGAVVAAVSTFKEVAGMVLDSASSMMGIYHTTQKFNVTVEQWDQLVDALRLGGASYKGAEETVSKVLNSLNQIKIWDIHAPLYKVFNSLRQNELQASVLAKIRAGEPNAALSEILDAYAADPSIVNREIYAAGLGVSVSDLDEMVRNRALAQGMQHVHSSLADVREIMSAWTSLELHVHNFKMLPLLWFHEYRIANPENFPKSLHDSPLFMSKETLEQRLEVPGFAEGGIVYKPTVINVAEKEPEVVVPKDQFDQIISMGGMQPGWLQVLVRRRYDEALATKLIQDLAEPGKGVWEGNPWPAWAGGLSGLAVPGSVLFGPSLSVVTQVFNSIAGAAMAGLFAGAIRTPVGAGASSSSRPTDAGAIEAAARSLEQTEKTNARAFTDIRDVLARLEKPVAKLAEGTDGTTTRPMRVEVGEDGTEWVNGKLVRGPGRITLPSGSRVTPLSRQRPNTMIADTISLPRPRPDLSDKYRSLRGSTNIEDFRDQFMGGQIQTPQDFSSMMERMGSPPNWGADVIAESHRRPPVLDDLAKGAGVGTLESMLVKQLLEQGILAKPRSYRHEPPNILAEPDGVMRTGSLKATIDLSKVQPKDTAPVFLPMPLQSPQGAVADEPVWQ